jgi:SAM-dependent methyltransferase
MADDRARAAGPPAVTDEGADGRFRERARHDGWDPDDRFVGGYVAWEWQHSRHLFDGLFTSVDGKRALEFGCHFGGTAVVLAALGAEVTAIDVDPQFAELAALNAERHGLGGRVRALHVADTARLPFEDRSFDLISCNSVLEYVPRDVLPAVQREIDRVLAPSGFVVILGTSNRLWPRESHSERWLMNYVPTRLRRLFPGKPIESVSPWRLRSGFPGYADLTLEDGGRLLIDLKARMGVSGPRRRVLEGASRLLAPLRMHVGFVSPTITMVLRKP